MTAPSGRRQAARSGTGGTGLEPVGGAGPHTRRPPGTRRLVDLPTRPLRAVSGDCLQAWARPVYRGYLRRTMKNSAAALRRINETGSPGLVIVVVEHTFDDLGMAGIPYAELHCHSNFSFLDGASHPEELVEEAARLGLEALALTDHEGVYGVVRFAEAAKAAGLPTVFGAELSIGSPGGRKAPLPTPPKGATATAAVARPRVGTADPAGEHLVVLARDPDGYARLCRAISAAQMAGAKGAPRHDLGRLAELHGGHWLVLTGYRKGAVPRALERHGPAAAAAQLGRLVAAVGREHVAVEVGDHGDPLDSARNDALVRLAAAADVEVVATNNVHYAVPGRRRLATALAAVRARRSLDELDGWLPAAATAHLRSGAEQAARLARYPGVVERAAELGRALAFDLQLVAPKLPDFPVPAGHTEMSWLRELAGRGAARRYGPRGAERVEGAWRQIDHELAMVEQLGFPGYFPILRGGGERPPGPPRGLRPARCGGGHPHRPGGAGRRRTGLSPPPRHPLGRDGGLRPAGGGGLPGRVGDHAGAQRAAVGQGRLRRGRAGQVRPARARHAERPARGRRPGPRAPRGRGRPGRAAAGAGRLRDALPRRLGRGVPGGEPRPDGHPAEAQAAALLRPGGRGGPDPPRPHPGRLGPPLHP